MFFDEHFADHFTVSKRNFKKMILQYSLLQRKKTIHLAWTITAAITSERF